MSRTIPELTLGELVFQAKNVNKNAYAPYSKFRVGAAILTETGEIFTGCNVENASYGLTICAERNAVFQMVASGFHRIAAIVIYTPTLEPTAPCGACRQVLNEFGHDALVVGVCDSDKELRRPLTELLPDSFGAANLC